MQKELISFFVTSLTLCILVSCGLRLVGDKDLVTPAPSAPPTTPQAETPTPQFPPVSVPDDGDAKGDENDHEDDDKDDDDDDDCKGDHDDDDRTHGDDDYDRSYGDWNGTWFSEMDRRSLEKNQAQMILKDGKKDCLE